MYDFQVQKTVENILDDMKAKYEAARHQLGGAQASANQALSNLDMIKQVQQQKLDEIKQLCRYALHLPVHDYAIAGSLVYAFGDSLQRQAHLQLCRQVQVSSCIAACLCILGDT